MVDPLGGRVDYGAVVLSHILPHRLPELEYAAERLTLDHFTDAIQRTLWQVMVDYWVRYREVFPAGYLIDLLERHGVEAGKILVLSNAYDSYVGSEVTEGQFRAAIDYLRDNLDRYQTGAALTLAYDILERGLERNGELLTGHRAAREFFLAEIAEIEDRDASEEAPEGDIRLETERLVRLYEEAQSNPDRRGIEFAVPLLDRETGGVQLGELCLIAAYTSQGKSQLCAQMAWHTAVVQQRGVYFATTETVRDTTIRRILSRHSRLARFGLPDGLNARDILRGTLSEREQRTYYDVIEDFSKTAALLHIAQMPRNATLELVAAGAGRVNRISPVELLAIDSLQLLVVPGSSRGEREDFNQILRQAKVLATTFANGRGVALVSPWQIKQASYTAALEAQHYTLTSLSDTSEAEKSTDFIVWLLLPRTTDTDSRLAKMGTLKLRDGALVQPFDIEVDYRTSFLGDHGGVPARSAAATATTTTTSEAQFAYLTGGIT